MRKILIVLVLALTASLVPEGAHAQRGGGILDFIAKLSGPKMIGPAFSIATSGDEIRFRGTIAYRVSFDSDDEIDPDGADITMWSLQPTVEVPLRGTPVEVTGGIALHRFGGDADAFHHVSLPFYLQAHIPLTPVVLLRTGLGLHYFPAFDADDFAPLVVDVNRSGGEVVVPAIYLGLDFVF